MEADVQRHESEERVLCFGRIKPDKARRPVPLKTVTMRLPVPDHKTARDLAQDEGLPYQTYIKMLLHEALRREEL